jgi:hypothetical protein
MLNSMTVQAGFERLLLRDQSMLALGKRSDARFRTLNNGVHGRRAHHGGVTASILGTLRSK